MAAGAAGLAVILRQLAFFPIIATSSVPVATGTAAVATATVPAPAALLPALLEASIATGASKGVPDVGRWPQGEQRLLDAAEDCNKPLSLDTVQPLSQACHAPSFAG